MGKAKSILDKSYFRAKEKEKVNELHLVTIHCIHQFVHLHINLDSSVKFYSILGLVMFRNKKDLDFQCLYGRRG